jgi:Zn-dependent peptidase ImmA (M78 family)/DNA-binding XRE family transcriptional regulator
MSSANQNFFGIRLKLARKMAGMSLQDLSDKLENMVAKQSLNKYEQGLMNPTSDVLLALAKTLKVKPDFFLKKDTLEIKEISFRKKANVSKKAEESVVEQARDYVERFFEIENIFNINAKFHNPLLKLIINDKNAVEHAANKLREAWKLGFDPISGIVEMLELKGVKVLLINYEDGIDGFSFLASNGIPVVVINKNLKSIERIRFTIIHELAHLLLEFDDQIKNDQKQIEKLCHYFSSCFLLPREMLIKMIGGQKRSYIDIKELVSIKEYYGISIRAIVHRLNEIGIITPNYYQRWVIYMSKTYGHKDEPGNYIGEEKQKLFEQLIIRALAEELISISKAASLLNIDINVLRKGAANVQ